jgi:hypothetical protein
MTAIGGGGQLCGAPYCLRDTGEPPVERSLGGVKPSQGYALFLFCYNGSPSERPFPDYFAWQLHGICMINPLRSRIRIAPEEFVWE